MVSTDALYLSSLSESLLEIALKGCLELKVLLPPSTIKAFC